MERELGVTAAELGVGGLRGAGGGMRADGSIKVRYLSLTPTLRTALLNLALLPPPPSSRLRPWPACAGVEAGEWWARTYVKRGECARV